ncbi:MAG: SDR family oxidoreductase, partial [Bacteroidales bacterium]|nr:SDR family oxidoreductase [Bacteroidales bacterium]
LAREFSQKGYRVFAADIDAKVLTLFKDLENVFSKKLDVTNESQVGSWAREISVESNGLDIMICLAGIYDSYPVTEADPQLFKQILAVNLFGTSVLVQAFLNPLLKNKGRIIVVTSESYKIQAMFQPYMITKAALEAYCRVARQELALKDVKLAIIRPGAIRTPLLNWMDTDEDGNKYPVFRKEYVEARKKSVKMVGRIASPEKVARIILRASTVKYPKRVYRINNNPVLTLISLIPSGIIDRLIVRIFK